YGDVQFLYGPFAPHFNASLYRLFGIQLFVLKISGAVCAILILLMIYRLARALMGEWESFLVAGLVMAVCALKSTANYIQPYAYAALYGLIFALSSLLCAVKYLQCRSIHEISGISAGGAGSPPPLRGDGTAARGLFHLALAGLLAGLSVISKP